MNTEQRAASDDVRLGDFRPRRQSLGVSRRQSLGVGVRRIAFHATKQPRHVCGRCSGTDYFNPPVTHTHQQRQLLAAVYIFGLNVSVCRMTKKSSRSKFRYRVGVS